MKIAWKGAATFAAIAAAAALVLSGCSDPGSGGGSAGATSWPAQDTKLDGVNLTIWAAQNSNKTPESVISGFEKLTGAKVKVVTIPDPYEQGIQTKVATGDKPDLAFWQPTASMLTTLNAKQNLQSLEGAPWAKNYTGKLGDMTGILDGTRYAALVTTPAVIGVYYNKAVFDKAGVAYPTADWTWDEFHQKAKQISDKLKAQGVYGVASGLSGGQEMYYNTILQAGGSIISDDGKKSGYDDPKSIKGLQFIRDLVADGSSPTPSQLSDTPQDQWFINSKSAMIWSGNIGS